ncbi:hypothetical protein [Acetobacter pasteurianus]|uniref:hypothetical protein n=1 Tax=Acetobacter pasteurianus TaxID=438 RepID=UPI000F57FECD|nr:hypothetical protein [Acetobacter pasteurianus]GCD57339.1 hypothetical protein NBRC3222_2676 [Acetobacter pasteurianus NBRC 3222]
MSMKPKKVGNTPSARHLIQHHGAYAEEEAGLLEKLAAVRAKLAAAETATDTLLGELIREKAAKDVRFSRLIGELTHTLSDREKAAYGPHIKAWQTGNASDENELQAMRERAQKAERERDALADALRLRGLDVATQPPKPMTPPPPQHAPTGAGASAEREPRSVAQPS